MIAGIPGFPIRFVNLENLVIEYREPDQEDKAKMDLDIIEAINNYPDASYVWSTTYVGIVLSSCNRS